VSLTPQERHTLIDRYADGPRLLRTALARVPEAALAWKPAPAQWSVHEVIVHCADSETNSALRVRTLLAEKQPLIVGYDQDEWARALDYAAEPLEPALAAVEAARARTVPLLRRLPDSAWQRAGEHTESGHFTAEQWLRIYAEHLDVHARQIDRNVAAWTARHGK
jgi:hypothetical protein